MNLKTKIRNVPNWPKKGVGFKDITPLLANPKYFKAVIDAIVRRAKDEKISKVVGIDARGFLLAAPVAYKLNAGLIIVRKKGKLPHHTISHEYELEYGKNTLEMHRDSIKSGERVLIVDDVLATGGTALAAAKLVEKLGGKIAGIAFLMELSFLGGVKKLKKYNVFSLVKYV